MPQPRHDLRGRTSKPLTEAKRASYLKNAKAFQNTILTGLSFETIIKDKSGRPCSLDDFTKYITYVEHDAGNLQFFFWYCDYVQRWSRLPQSKKALSPVWRSARRRANPKSTLQSMDFRDTAEKLDRILEILDQCTPTMTTGDQVMATDNKPTTKIDSVDTNFSRPRTPTATTRPGATNEAQTEWEPFSVQPFREEIAHIVRRYISTTNPLQLNLTQQDRTACMHAVQHTTHPSALLPAFTGAEAVLRGRSHPSFIRWSVRNGNGPRIWLVRILGVVLTALALALDVFFILSSVNRFMRWEEGGFVLVYTSDIYANCVHGNNLRM
ncbi:hypothetical protein F5B20DRAFT_594396 [Whalleya microplaca]|nr:hypothetical protein F5B20DRAFT_594396 [Whalleya microplaca]